MKLTSESHLMHLKGLVAQMISNYVLVRYWYTLHTFIALIYQTEHYNSFYNEFLEFDILTKTIEMYFNLGDVKAHNYICKKSLSCISKMCHI